ncbi:hypothetical protein DDV21_000230 [Streptococcus chenjunshii]|uniref:Uncharacterized protein n=1 Tax=Streptococcus chenjunshii TaxID=2173853 RepID=A0A372KKG7_9STRE|nr:hypothetical protein DDV21_000230 [Streptococcus chenjunshii]RFU50623.1 hypothetical protein DDV22_07820 [Streptococcus chenjunshii]RFU52760.1 hypothetical protein DDV23_08115 [Streptococcus chenjunshii]
MSSFFSFHQNTTAIAHSKIGGKSEISDFADASLSGRQSFQDGWPMLDLSQHWIYVPFFAKILGRIQRYYLILLVRKMSGFLYIFSIASFTFFVKLTLQKK